MCQEFCPQGRFGSASVHAGIPHPLSPTRQAPPSRNQAGSPLDQAPPRSRACWEIRSTSGRYASYWNYYHFSEQGFFLWINFFHPSQPMPGGFPFGVFFHHYGSYTLHGTRTGTGTGTGLGTIENNGSLSLFRWFKFTLKPPYSIAHDKLRLAIWDTSFWTFWLKFGHKGP